MELSNQADNKRESDSFVIFQINEQFFGINVMDCREIVQLEEITAVPDSPDFVEGVIDLREKITPIVNINKKFNLKEDKESRDKIIVISIDNNLIGIKVDEVDGISSIKQNEIKKAPKIAQKMNDNYIEGIGKKDEELIILLDVEQIFSNAEIDKISEIN